MLYLFQTLTIVSCSFASALMLAGYVIKRDTVYLWISAIWGFLTVSISSPLLQHYGLSPSEYTDMYFNQFYFLADFIGLFGIVLALSFLILYELNQSKGGMTKKIVIISTVLIFIFGIILVIYRRFSFTYLFQLTIVVQVLYSLIHIKKIPSVLVRKYVKYVTSPLVWFLIFSGITFSIISSGAADLAVKNTIQELSGYILLLNTLFFSLVSIFFSLFCFLPSFSNDKNTGGFILTKSERNPLSRREEEIFPMILAGKTNEEIAQDLYVAVTTVKSHVKNILKKYDVKTKKDLIAKMQNDED